MDQLFKLSERGTSVGQEVRAGVTTFLAMAYIIAVNPVILAAAGVPLAAAITSTCVGAAIVSALMGLVANRPVALASGMGLNAIVAYAITGVAAGDWQAAMAVVFVEGIVIGLLTVSGLREAIMRAIPESLLHAIACGVGLFIAMVGLIDGGVLVANESTVISLGTISADNMTMAVGLISIAATAVLYLLKVRGALLLGILVALVCGIPLGVTPMPTGLVSGLDVSAFAAPFQVGASGVMGVVKVLTTPALLVYAFSFMMTDFFDTMGGVVAIAQQGDFIDEDGQVQDIAPILAVDSMGAAIGGFLGASSVTTFVESATGCAEGGRTGLTSVVAAALFFVAAFFAPVISCVTSAAACGALVVVGFLTMESVAKIDFADMVVGFPSFLVVVCVPLTYSISAGIGLGFISYVVLCAVSGRVREVKPLMWVAAAAFMVYFFIAVA